MRPNALWLLLVATFVHTGCALRVQSRSIALASATEVMAVADLTPSPGSELILSHDSELAIYAWSGLDAAPAIATVVGPGPISGIAGLDPGVAIVTFEDGSPPRMLTSDDEGWSWQPVAGAAPAAVSGTDVFTGDLDGDMRVDVGLLARHPSTLLTRMTHAGAGSVELTPVPQRLPTAIAVDIDLDGSLDVVCSMQTGGLDAPVPDHLRVFRTSPGGLFDETWYQTPRPGRLAAGDLDGDRRPEVVAFGSAGVWILWNIGRGWFSQPDQLSRLSAVDGAVLDFDRDGRFDLAVVDGDHGHVRVWLNAGAGQFRPRRDFEIGSAPTRLLALPRPQGEQWLVAASSKPAQLTVSRLDAVSWGGKRSRRTTTSRAP